MLYYFLTCFCVIYGIVYHRTRLLLELYLLYSMILRNYTSFIKYIGKHRVIMVYGYYDPATMISYIDMDGLCISIYGIVSSGIHIGYMDIVDGKPCVYLNYKSYLVNLFEAMAGKGTLIGTRYYTNIEDDRLKHVEMPDDF